MKPINQFLLHNNIRISDNPCISPDFCLDWPALVDEIKTGAITEYAKSEVVTKQGNWILLSGPKGDYAWKLEPASGVDAVALLADGEMIAQHCYYPASYENLIRVKNLFQESDPKSTVFPGTEANLSTSTLGIGARFTTLHWPGVFWAMKTLGMGFTANQNSIPRELVYNVDKMLEDQLDSVPFPFIGTNVPEGHQGQSVQGMSQGSVLENLKSGFHRARLPWSFNADHQPIGGKFDIREDDLVTGCLFATYITFDLSPELADTKIPDSPEARKSWVEANVGDDLVIQLRGKVTEAGYDLDEDEFLSLICYVWPSMKKMKVRDEKYRKAREDAFSTEKGRAYIRELSIDELPGLTTPQTTAIMLALCELMDMPINFVAPAFGFQKNMPYADNDELKRLIQKQWDVCKTFGVSIGFHSGSGKSAENYQVMGEVTGANLEIKTSGRYTYEMGIALHASKNETDQALWKDWFEFTLELAVKGAFSEQKTEKDMARSFIEDAYATLKLELPTSIYESLETCRACLQQLPMDPNLMFWFEYNFLYVLAAEGRAEKAALGDHSPAGYAQRKRFYTISEEGRLNYCKRVAAYIIFLAQNTGLVSVETCTRAQQKLDSYSSYPAFIDDIEG